MMRNTRQRNCIFDIVNNSYEHLTAYQVYDKAKQVISNISLGTVYRNLSWLCENNKIKYFIVDGIVRYDRKDEHDHFICRECNNIIDIVATKQNDTANSIIVKPFLFIITPLFNLLMI